MTRLLDRKTIRVEIEPRTIPEHIHMSSFLIDPIWSILNRTWQVLKTTVLLDLLHSLKFLQHQKIHLGVSFWFGLRLRHRGSHTQCLFVDGSLLVAGNVASTLVGHVERGIRR
jgi:hypothetical protein